MKRGAIDHPKTKRLARAIGAPAYAAMGLVEAIVHWAAKYAPAGNVGKYEDLEIEDAVDWSGEPGTMVPILVETGWLDAHDEHRVVIHDWFDHADDAVHMCLARAAERFWCGRVPKLTRLGRAERERAEALYARRAHEKHTEYAQEAHCPPLPSPPLPSPSLQAGDTQRVDPQSGPSFLAFWHAYPARGRTRMSDCKAAWGEAVDIAGNAAQIVSKASEYAKSPRGSGRYCLAAHRWLEGRCWEDAPEAWQDGDDDTQPAKPRRDYEALAKGGAA